MGNRYVSKARAQDIWSRLVNGGITKLEESLLLSNSLKFYPFIEPYLLNEDSKFDFLYKRQNIILYTLVTEYLAKGDVSKEFFELCFSLNIDTLVQFSIFNQKFPVDKVLESDEFTLHQKREMIYLRHEEVYSYLAEGSLSSGLGNINSVPLDMLFKVLDLDIRLLDDPHVKRTIFSKMSHSELLDFGKKND